MLAGRRGEGEQHPLHVHLSESWWPVAREQGNQKVEYGVGCPSHECGVSLVKWGTSYETGKDFLMKVYRWPLERMK